MGTKAKAPPIPPCEEAIDWTSPPLTTGERLRRIKILGQRVRQQIQFMCTVGGLGGSSAEAKEGAVAAFYERLVVLERQLGKIQEDFQLR